MAFINYEKAFDSVSTEAILMALSTHGIDHQYIVLLYIIYKEATAIIRLHKDSRKIKINEEFVKRTASH